MEVKNLPENVLRNIIEFKLGEPEYVKIKHSETLKRIQNKFKITRYGVKKTTKRLKHSKMLYKLEYCILREGVPFSLKSIEDIITGEQEELLSLIYEIVEDSVDFKVNLEIEAQIVARIPDREYGEDEFSYRDIYFIDDFDDEYVNQYNLSHTLNQAVDEIQEDIDEDTDKDSIIGIQAFHFKLTVIDSY